MFVVHDRELPPDRIVRDQPVAVQRLRKYMLTECPRFGLAHLREARTRESRLIDFHDERAEVRRIPIVMRVERAGFGFAECLGQRLKALVRAEPGKAVGKKAYAGAEAIFVATAHQ